VSMRHHANTFAYRFGVPTVGFAICEKISAHFRQIRQEQLLVDPLAPDARGAEQAADAAIRDRPSLSEQLRHSLAQARASMDRSMDRMAEEA